MNTACAPFRPLLSPALDGALEPRERAALDRHLAACADCRAVKTRLTTTVDLLRKTPLTDAPADFVARLEARLEEGAEALAAAPTLVIEPVSNRRVLALVKVIALVGCLSTASFLAMMAFTAKTPTTPGPEPAQLDDLTPVPVPPQPPQPALPPPLIPAVPRPDKPEPERPSAPDAVTSDSLTQEIMKQFPDPGVENHPLPPTEKQPPPPPPEPPVVAQAPPPPAPPPSSIEKQPPPTASVKKLDEAALARLLVAIFEDPSTPDERRPEVIAALGEFPHKRACDALAQILGGALDAKPLALACRAAAWDALGAIGNEDAVKTLLAVRTRDDTRFLLALARVQDPKAVTYLGDRLKDHPDADARVLMARALGRGGKREAVPGLVRALVDPRQDVLVRAEAALALGVAGDAEAQKALVAALDPRQKVPVVRAAAARALGTFSLRTGSAEPARVLVGPLAKDEHPLVREACALALGKSRQLEVAMKPLVERLDPKKERAVRVRTAADAALVDLTGLFRTADEWRRALDAEKPGLRGVGPIAVARTSFERLLASGQGTVVLLDRSGSMEQLGKMALAKKTALAVLDALPASTAESPVGFDIVCFADAATTFYPRLIENTPESRGQARAGLERQRAWFARTDLLRGLRSALAIEGVDSVVLLTDGVPTLGVSDPEQLLLEVSRENAGKGARIHVVALQDARRPLVLDSSEKAPEGEAAEISFLRRLALDNGGTFVKN
jgi:HEAT repeat protein